MWDDDTATKQIAHRYFKGGAPGDEAYHRWLRTTLTSLARATSHPIASDDERQWAERAVMEGVLAWQPGELAVILG
jgi:hypothetical protein